MILHNQLSSNYLIVSFYTVGHYHKVINNHLLPSLQKFNLPYYIESVESTHDWSGNTNIKPFFIQSVLNKFPEKTIIWIDADAKVEAPPYLFKSIPEKYDMGVFYLDLDAWYSTSRHSGRKELGTGIVMFRNRPVVMRVIKKWIEGVKHNPKIWEQKHLQTSLESIPVKAFQFPLPYSYIYTLPNGQQPNIKVDHPVIVQYQASREIRRTKVSI